MDWENQLEKNRIQKIEKTVKIRVKIKIAKEQRNSGVKTSTKMLFSGL